MFGVHRLLYRLPNRTSARRRLFASQQELVNNVKENKLGDVKTVVRTLVNDHLTPFQKYCVDGGVERAFTGDIWYEKDVGTYHCSNCDTEIFRYSTVTKI